MSIGSNTAVLERVVGYDLRDYRDDFAQQWPKQRQDQFLYREDVKKVLSVDARVWPALLPMLDPSMEYQRALQDLWASRMELRDRTSQMGMSVATLPFRTVAITLVSDGAEDMHPVARDLAGLVDPAVPKPEWRLLGYDVADAWLLSVLANCGFVPGFDDVIQLRRSWGPLLNEFHLFNELAAASAFRRMSDQRLAGDHAPTFVYGIRLIRA